MTFVRGHFRRTRSGYTYVRPSVRRSSSGAGALVTVGLVAAVLVVAIIAAAVRFVVDHWVPIAATILASGVLAGGVLLSGWLRRRHVDLYLGLAREIAHGADGLYDDLLRLSRRVPADDQHRVVGEEEIYTTLIAEILADGEVSDEECERLKRINEAFVFDPHRAIEIRQEAFDGFVAWVGVDLTEQQETALCCVAARLEIPQTHTERWLAMVAGRRAERAQQAAFAERQRQAAIEAEHTRQAALVAERERQAALAERQRQAAIEAELQREAALMAERQRQAALAIEREQSIQKQRNEANTVYETERRVPVAVDVKLKRGEACWLSTRANLRDRKATRIGSCLVTNKRLLFIADSAVSIDLSRMLDVAADPDSGVLRIIKDGRKTPYEFEFEQPLVALAHVERSMQEANGER